MRASQVGQWNRIDIIIPLDSLHSIDEASDVVGPFLGLDEVEIVLFYESSEVAFQGYHFFIWFVASFCLELGVDLFDFSRSDEVCAGVVVVEYFHSDDSACFVFFWDEFLADDIRETE